ncbi:DMT family transporter [Loktanella sp. SALINAS62]|uniref:DMT family transporter n=1 Tax=Loktanella sp. SALINAS62 TaxID=2706124 RepID=UPI0020115233|nr:DMT family transporter [Loktanella sp. SALINAS62]
MTAASPPKMRLFVLVALTMVAFAANSVLNRYAVAGQDMAPLTFATLRVAAGAVVLLALARPRLSLSPDRLAGAGTLAAYVIGFSWAYRGLAAGLGALILFGCVQLGMFGVAVLRGNTVPPRRWAGSAVALGGLAVLLWPTEARGVPLWPALAMVIAGLGWAGYTLLGQSARDPLASSAVNFALCLPLVVFALALSGQVGPLTTAGVVAAVVSGALTSGLGYALWYRLLPRLATTMAATAQLSVPLIAVAAGALFLAEPLTIRLLASAVLVLGGIALSLGR